jgi:hypothetical protein
MEISNVTLTEPIQAVTESMVSHLNISRDISCSIRCWECNNKVTFVALRQARPISLSRQDVGRFTCPYCNTVTNMRDCEATERMNCRTFPLY